MSTPKTDEQIAFVEMQLAGDSFGPECPDRPYYVLSVMGSFARLQELEEAKLNERIRELEAEAMDMSNAYTVLEQKNHDLKTKNALWKESFDRINRAHDSAVQRIAELEAEVAAQEREREALNASWHSRCLRTEIRAEAAENKLRAVAELPGKWRGKSDESRPSREGVIYDKCADELEALLKEQKP